MWPRVVTWNTLETILTFHNLSGHDVAYLIGRVKAYLQLGQLDEARSLLEQLRTVANLGYSETSKKVILTIVDFGNPEMLRSQVNPGTERQSCISIGG